VSSPSDPPARAEERADFWGRLVLWYLFANAIAAWLLALDTVDRAGLPAMGDLGLAPLLPTAFYVSLALLTIGFAVALHRTVLTTGVLAAYVAGLIVVWHATPALLYGAPRYPFTFKHIGLGAFVQDNGRLALEYDAYFNWPGFFTLSALVSDLGGLDGPFALAAWGPVFMNVLIAGAVLVLARALTDDPRHAWLAVWFFLGTSWVGQDYFAPQALGFGLHVLVLGLYVGGFAARRWRIAVGTGDAHGEPRRRATDAHPDAEPNVVSTLGGTVHRRAWASEPARPSAGRRVGLLATVLLTYTAVVASHQLSPFVTLASIAALVVLRLGRAAMLPVAMGAILATWFATMTTPYLAGHLGELLAGVGRVFDNLSASSRILASPDDVVLSAERVLVLNVRQWLTLVVAGLAIVGGIRRVRRGHVDWVAIVLLLVPAGMVALQSYGGEILLRIYLFALPLLAWFAAAVVYPDRTSGRRWTAPLVVVLLSGSMAAGMSFAYYGNESMNHVTAPENAVLEALYADAPDGALVVTLTTNAPIRMARYTDLAYVHLGALPPFDDDDTRAVADVAALAATLAARVDDEARPAAYVLFTRSELATARLFGELAGVDLAALDARLTASADFALVARSDGGSLHRWSPSAATP
jgi:hypothetical protein